MPDMTSGTSPPSLGTVASPLPTLESESFQSRCSGKRDGIHDVGSSFGVSFGTVLERVMIHVGDAEWMGWTFDPQDKGLFLQGGNWGEVDLRKGLVAILELAECLGCSHLIVGLENTLADKLTLLRALMPLGFQLIKPKLHPHSTGTLIGMTI